MTQRSMFDDSPAPEGGRDPMSGEMSRPLSSAILSEDRVYRYALTRFWNAGHPGRRLVNFVMLNPSKADEDADDPTIRRCVGFAKRWGYGGLVVTNLYALRATDPRELHRHPDPIGPEDDEHLRDAARLCEMTVCAWGADGFARERARAVTALIEPLARCLACLRRTKDGHPCHPLYLPADLDPLVFSLLIPRDGAADPPEHRMIERIEHTGGLGESLNLIEHETP